MSAEFKVQAKFLEACKYNLQLKPGQRLLIFHDSTSESILNLLKPAIDKSGYDTEIFNMGPKRPYGSIPTELSKKISDHEAVIGFFNYEGHDDWNRSELSFRMDLINFIQSKPIRYAHAPGSVWTCCPTALSNAISRKWLKVPSSCLESSTEPGQFM